MAFLVFATHADALAASATITQNRAFMGQAAWAAPVEQSDGTRFLPQPEEWAMKGVKGSTVAVFVRPIGAPLQRVVSASAFRDLFTDAERIAVRKADDRLADAELMAMAQNSINLDSPRAVQFMALAVSKGALTRARADQILAGQPAP